MIFAKTQEDLRTLPWVTAILSCLVSLDPRGRVTRAHIVSEELYVDDRQVRQRTLRLRAPRTQRKYCGNCAGGRITRLSEVHFGIIPHSTIVGVLEEEGCNARAHDITEEKVICRRNSPSTSLLGSVAPDVALHVATSAVAGFAPAARGLNL